MSRVYVAGVDTGPIVNLEWNSADEAWDVRVAGDFHYQHADVRAALDEISQRLLNAAQVCANTKDHPAVRRA